MRKVLIVIFFLIFCMNCGISPLGYIGHSTNTQVILSEANYKIVATVKGQSQAVVILGIGPSDHKLYAQAKSDLYSKLHQSINLKDKSYALINITSDESYNFFLPPLFISKIVTVSADVIVFNESEIE